MPTIEQIMHVQRRLVDLGLLTRSHKTGFLDDATLAAVRAYQRANNLIADGIPGPITQGHMFPSVSNREHQERIQTNGFGATVINLCHKYDGLREIGNTNRGEQIDKWARQLGLPLGVYWCMSAVQGIFLEASQLHGIPDPLMPNTGGCMDLWNRAPKDWRVGKTDGRRADIAIWNHGGGTGHTGIVDGYKAGVYTTWEGNTNNEGSRNGYEFCQRDDRKYSDPRLMGFIRVPAVRL